MTKFTSPDGSLIVTQQRSGWPHGDGESQSHKGAKPARSVTFYDADGGVAAVLLNGPSGMISNAKGLSSNFGYEDDDSKSVLCVPDGSGMLVVQPDGAIDVASEERFEGVGKSVAVKVPKGLKAVGLIKAVISEKEKCQRGYPSRYWAGLGLYPMQPDGAVASAPSLIYKEDAAKMGKDRVAHCPNTAGPGMGISRVRKAMTVAPGVDAVIIMALASEWDALEVAFMKADPVGYGGGAMAG